MKVEKLVVGIIGLGMGKMHLKGAIEYGAEIGFPKVQVPEGYAMDSQWYTDADCTVPFVEGTTMGTAPVTLYTTIDIVPYKAYFLLDEGDDLADAYAVVDAEYLEPIEVPADPTKEGFVFAGWTPYVGILDKEEDVVFYATWEEEVHNVVYYLNNGTDAVYETYDVPFNYDLEVPAAPVREGYIFKGWSPEPSEKVTGSEENGKYYFYFCAFCGRSCCLFGLQRQRVNGKCV